MSLSADFSLVHSQIPIISRNCNLYLRPNLYSPSSPPSFRPLSLTRVMPELSPGAFCPSPHPRDTKRPTAHHQACEDCPRQHGLATRPVPACSAHLGPFFFHSLCTNSGGFTHLPYLCLKGLRFKFRLTGPLLPAVFRVIQQNSPSRKVTHCPPCRKPFFSPFSLPTSTPVLLST